MGLDATALVVINRQSSRAKRPGVANALAKLEAGGLNLDVRATDSPRDIPLLIREGAGHAGMVLVGGGDGTLHTAAEAVVESGLPLGILPLGTANDLADSLGIGSGLDKACEAVLGGRTKAINLGTVNGKLFFNTVHAGMSVDMIKRLTARDKGRFGFLAYFLKMFATYWRSRPFSARITCGEAVRETRAMELFVANGERYGGGFRVSREASLTRDDLLCHVVAPQGFPAMIMKVPAFYKGTLQGKSGVTFLTGEAFRIETEPVRALIADGELAGRTPADIGLVSRALPVFVPGDGENVQGER